jgi:arylsulfatase A-like enzyme/cytochrome c-type biogenesis protein CcmH/NrfG
MNSRARAAAGVAVLVVLAGAAWSYLGSRRHEIVTPAGSRIGPASSGVDAGGLNVLVLTLDTTRWDRLGAYGDRAAATPNLDRLAAEGVLFEHAIAPAPLTLPAHSTLFTGMLPPRHGVRDNGGYVLDPKHATLASLLKAAGWQTGAFVGAFVLDSKWGLNQGFDTYVDKFDVSKYKQVSLGGVSRRAGEVVGHAMPWLEQHGRNRFFAWLHFYDAHTPYDPPEPFRTRFADRPYSGEIAYVDYQVGRVLQWLDTNNLTDRTIIVAIGDHGESLNEHGEATHGLFIYDATVRVPFIIRAPFASMKGRRVADTVRSEDLMPTILDLVGQRPAADVQGRTLVPLMTGEARALNLDAYSESLYARNHYGWSELKALRSGRFKYIQTTRPELYDLERDPNEEHNLFDERRQIAERMAAELTRVGVEAPGASEGPSAVDPETRERLAALGYIGSFTAAAHDGDAVLPDPKDKIDIFNLMTAAREADESQTHATLNRLKKVVAQDPNVLDAWVMLGNEYFRQGDYRTAANHYRTALKLNPSYDLAIVNLAGAYRSMGDYEAAIVGYERYLEKDPKNAWIRYQLGELYVERGELAKAESAFQQALADDTRVAAARNALGVVAFKRGDLDGAERQIREALAQKPDVRLAHFNLALIAEQRRDYRAAIDFYRREIDTQAGAYKAAFNLSRVYDQLGNKPEEEAALKKAIELNPRFAEGYFYLAKLYLDEGRQLDEAISLAQRGLELGGDSEFAPLGHYVLADIYNRRGRAADAAREAARGRALERSRRSGQ